MSEKYADNSESSFDRSVSHSSESVLSASMPEVFYADCVLQHLLPLYLHSPENKGEIQSVLRAPHPQSTEFFSDVQFQKSSQYPTTPRHMSVMSIPQPEPPYVPLITSQFSQETQPYSVPLSHQIPDKYIPDAIHLKKQHDRPTYDSFLPLKSFRPF